MKLTLKARVSAVIASLAALSLAIGLLGLYGMRQTNEGLRTVYDDRTVALEQVSRIDRLLVQNQLALAQAMLDPTPASMKSASDRIEANIAEVNQTWAVYMATYLTPEEKLLADKFTADRAKMLDEGLKPALGALREAQPELAKGLEVRLRTLVAPVTDGIRALRTLQVDEAKKEYELSGMRYLTMRAVIMGAITLGTALAAGFGFLLVRHLYRQLGGEPRYAAQIVHSIARGDLTTAIALRDGDRESLLFSMQEMQQDLTKTVSTIQDSTVTIASASQQIAAGNLDLSARTEQQAGALEETASSMEELTSTVKQNADSARQANQLAIAASEVAVKGSHVTSQVVATMGAINTSSRRIADIISVIDGIAFQTNILALNAAVEAARAGEQGRGFAVVASEVRSLAQRSAAAAKEIKVLIDDSVQQVDVGAGLVDEAGQTMLAIVDGIKGVAGILGEITAATHEQTAGLEQINRAIDEMDQVTQQNAALVEEASAAANSLEEQAQHLTELVSVFQIAGAHPSVARPALRVSARGPASGRTSARALAAPRTGRADDSMAA
jgi:methyl-accepting chemotaxis protein